MKIKTKKQLNLPQLIEWIEMNRSYGEVFTSDKYNCVHVTDDGILDFVGTFYDDTFTVEVEEEIAEDTKIANLLDVHLNIFDDVFTKCHKNKSIKEVKDDDRQSQAFYILNDDLTMTLIWSDGKLVD